MPLKRVGPGAGTPHSVNVVIEIPLRGDPVKYEVDKESGAVFVDRFMGTAMHYPCNYGYVPQTLAEDGDPLDALVISPFPLISGAVIACRPVGMLHMTDESGPDAKILVVPDDRLTDLYRDVGTLRDLPVSLLDQIQHFFEHYKDLESGKWVHLDGWRDGEAAKDEIRRSIARHAAQDRKEGAPPDPLG